MAITTRAVGITGREAAISNLGIKIIRCNHNRPLFSLRGKYTSKCTISSQCQTYHTLKANRTNCHTTQTLRLATCNSDSSLVKALSSSSMGRILSSILGTLGTGVATPTTACNISTLSGPTTEGSEEALLIKMQIEVITPSGTTFETCKYLVN